MRASVELALNNIHNGFSLASWATRMQYYPQNPSTTNHGMISVQRLLERSPGQPDVLFKKSYRSIAEVGILYFNVG